MNRWPAIAGILKSRIQSGRPGVALFGFLAAVLAPPMVALAAILVSQIVR
jgi:hypothetical protein